jgi:hypothetical protein
VTLLQTSGGLRGGRGLFYSGKTSSGYVVCRVSTKRASPENVKMLNKLSQMDPRAGPYCLFLATVLSTIQDRDHSIGSYEKGGCLVHPPLMAKNVL